MAVELVGYFFYLRLSLCVLSFSRRYLKNRRSYGIAKLDFKMLHDDPGNPFILRSKG